MLDNIINGMERGARAVSELLYGPVHSYCRLETVDGDVLVADDGSLISVLRLEGSLKHVGTEEFTGIVSTLTEKLQSMMAKPGHSIQLVFEYDPESSASQIAGLLRPSQLTAQNLGLHIGDLLDDWGSALNRYCSRESCWVVLWTRLAVLPDSQKKEALKERSNSMKKAPTLAGCQQVSRAVNALHDAHSGFTAGVLDAFRQADLLVFPLTPHEALREIRMCIAPELTSRDWTALIPGDPLPLRLPYEDRSESDLLHNVIYPDFKSQLWPCEGEMVSRTAVRIGDRLFGPLIMTLMPQTPKPFQELFRVLSRREEKVPYRISFLFEHGGLNMGIKPVLASILSFSSSDNRRFNKAVEKLRELDLSGICCIKFRICLCTWACLNGLTVDSAHALLRRSRSLSRRLQGQLSGGRA